MDRFTINKSDGLNGLVERIQQKVQNEKIESLKELVISSLKVQEELKEQINKLNQKVASQKKTINKKELTLKQQILMFHYLGIFKSIDSLGLTAEKKGKLISLLIDKSPKNTTTDLSHLNTGRKKDSEVFTTDNLEKILKFFEQLNLKEQIEAINKDLIELK